MDCRHSAASGVSLRPVTVTSAVVQGSVVTRVR